MLDSCPNACHDARIPINRRICHAHDNWPVLLPSGHNTLIEGNERTSRLSGSKHLYSRCKQRASHIIPRDPMQNFCSIVIKFNGICRCPTDILSHKVHDTRMLVIRSYINNNVWRCLNRKSLHRRPRRSRGGQSRKNTKKHVRVVHVAPHQKLQPYDTFSQLIKKCGHNFNAATNSGNHQRPHH